MKNILPIITVSFLVLLVSGCLGTNGGVIYDVKSLSDIKSDEIIVVGKVKLDPPLHKQEQDFKNEFSWIVGESSNLKNKFFFALKNSPINITDSGVRWSEGVTPVEIEDVFFIKRKKANVLYYSGGLIKVNQNIQGGKDAQYFPGKHTYKISPDSKAIYVGTIEYRRDEFGSILGIKIIDEYTEARRIFVKKFGNKIKLMKVKARKDKI